MTPEERARAFRSAERHLKGHGPARPRAALLALAEEAGDDPPDVYGTGAVLQAFEREVAALLGKPAAVYVPSGTMAQQVALRIAADRRGVRTVAFHPTCHLELHEQRGYAHVHGLVARLVGHPLRPIRRSDLDAVAEPVAALLLELPQREIGGVLPSWDELQDLVAWARERGTALHLDGARLWETTPFYGRPLDAIALPFDTVYVSFYKILGGVSGAALLGDEPTIAHARVWIRRLGGNLVTQYPAVLAARAGLRAHLPRVPAYCARARAVARLLVAAGARVTPDPPHTNMMQVAFPVEADALVDAAAGVARDRGVVLMTAARPAEVPGFSVTELVLGSAADAVDDEELAALLAELLERARP